MAFDFPNAPTTGQVYNGYTWDGEKWVLTYNAPNTSGVVAIQVFTANGTYVPSANMTTCVIECYGGGGGGGGVAGAASTTKVASGGGAGGYSRKLLTAAQVGTSQVVTIGVAGAGAAAGANPGGHGGNTSVGSFCIANGGDGGTAAGFSAYGAAGGGAGTGDFTATGASANSVGGDTTASMQIGVGGTGANSPVGRGGVGGLSNAGAMQGYAPGGYASGGGGASAQNSTATAIGSPGAPGVVIITEYGMTALSTTTINSQNAVRYDLPQGLSSSQQAQGRSNIGVANKNYIINGAMMISQENGNTAGTTYPYFPVDMFGIGGNGITGAFTIAQQASTSGAPYRIRVTVTTTGGANGTGGGMQIQQAIEGYRVADLYAGNAQKRVTLQFGVRGPAGTYCVAFRNKGTTRAYVAEYTIAPGEAYVDVVKSVSLNWDNGTVWAVDNSVGVYITWALATGPDYQTATPGMWVNGNMMATANQSNFFGVNGAIFELFNVGLYEGSVAPPFVVPDYASELNLCKRYFEMMGMGINGHAQTNTNIECLLQFTVQKRAAPSVTMMTTTPGILCVQGYLFGVGSVGSFNAGPDYGTGCVMAVGGFTGLVPGQGFVANTTNWFKVDARI